MSACLTVFFFMSQHLHKALTVNDMSLDCKPTGLVVLSVTRPPSLDDKRHYVNTTVGNSRNSIKETKLSYLILLPCCLTARSLSVIERFGLTSHEVCHKTSTRGLSREVLCCDMCSSCIHDVHVSACL